MPLLSNLEPVQTVEGSDRRRTYQGCPSPVKPRPPPPGAGRVLLLFPWRTRSVGFASWQDVEAVRPRLFVLFPFAL